jgi:hypothetical protein
VGGNGGRITGVPKTTLITPIVKASYRHGGKHSVDQLMAALSVEAPYGVVRERFHALDLEALLQRPNHAVSETWVDDVAKRLRRAMVVVREADRERLWLID